jgi:hypothetical protein
VVGRGAVASWGAGGRPVTHFENGESVTLCNILLQSREVAEVALGRNLAVAQERRLEMPGSIFGFQRARAERCSTRFENSTAAVGSCLTDRS